jgi:hypothetical protein
MMRVAVFVALVTAAVGIAVVPAAPGTAVPPSKRPMLVYYAPGHETEVSRLHGSTVGQQSVVTVKNDGAIRQVTFYLDEPAASGKVYAVDRKAPFVLARKGGQGKRAFTLGNHTLQADLELRTGRHARLKIAYSVALSLEIANTVSGSDLQRSIESMSPGPVLVHPPSGAASFGVDGGLVLKRAGVMLQGAQVAGTIDFDPGSDGSSFVGGSAHGFGIFGADDITIRGSSFDGQGQVKDSQIWDEPAGAAPDRFRIIGNTFQNFYIGEGSDVHSQAIFVGYSTNGLIEGNRFTNNGTTSHIFLSWFGTEANPAESYPRNICIRDNTFGPTHGAFSAVNLRREIPLSSDISVDPSNVLERGVGLLSDDRFARSC